MTCETKVKPCWKPRKGKWQRTVYDYVPVGQRERIVPCGGCGELFLSVWKYRSNGWPKTCKRECQRRYLSEKQAGARNTNWHGTDITYYGLHCWIKRQLEKPITCAMCGQEKALDVANVSGEYRRDLDDWEWLCRQCHSWKDTFKRRIWKLLEVQFIRHYSY